MHLNISVFLAAVTAGNAFAKPIARSPYVVKETHHVPPEWTKQERSHGQKTIQLQIGLKQGRFDELDRHLQEGTLPAEQGIIFKRKYADPVQYLTQITSDMANISVARKWTSLLHPLPKRTIWSTTGFGRTVLMLPVWAIALPKTGSLCICPSKW